MRLIKKIVEKTGIRSEALPGTTIVELSGNDRVLVENYKNVILVDVNSVVLEVSFGLLTICGNNLNIEYLEIDRILIIGKIEEVLIGKR